MEINFIVRGFEADSYNVTFRKTDYDLIALCNCLAAQNGMHCKHRLRILQGSTEGILSNNLNEVKVVQSWYRGSKIEASLKDLNAAEEELDQINKKISHLKRNLAMSLFGK